MYLRKLVNVVPQYVWSLTDIILFRHLRFLVSGNRGRKTQDLFLLPTPTVRYTYMFVSTQVNKSFVTNRKVTQDKRLTRFRSGLIVGRQSP